MKKGREVFPSLPFIYRSRYCLYPDFNFKESEEQEEQGNGQNDLQGFLTEQLLDPAAQHPAGKSTDDNSDHQPHVRKVTGHQVSDKRADTGKTGADE